MLSEIRFRLDAGEILVGDGGVGELLSDQDQVRECEDGLPIPHEEDLAAIAWEYDQAGAMMIQTRTGGASPLHLAARGLAGMAARVNAAAVEVVRRTVTGGIYVVGACGPSGRRAGVGAEARAGAAAGLEAVGDGELRRSYLAQFRALAQAGADALLVQAMADLEEAVIAVQAAREVAAGLPVLATMSFRPGPDGFRTKAGVSPAEAAVALVAAGADIVGATCGCGCEQMVEVVRELRRATDRPLLAQPNAGKPERGEGRLVYPDGPEFMAAHVQALVAAGARIVGGCCGTTPDHIRSIRRAVNRAMDARAGGLQAV